MEHINIETELYPEVGKLIFSEESQSFESVIFDAELDPLECTFPMDETVIINTQGYEYLQLDRRSLKKLLKLLSSAMSEYEDMGFDKDED